MLKRVNPNPGFFLVGVSFSTDFSGFFATGFLVAGFFDCPKLRLKRFPFKKPKGFSLGFAVGLRTSAVAWSCRKKTFSDWL